MSIPNVDALDETLEGLYTLTVTPLNGEFHVRTKWSAAKKNKPKTKRFHKLADDLIYAIERECSKVGLGQTVQVKGFTEMKTLDGDNAVLYRASPWYLELEWYGQGPHAHNHTFVGSQPLHCLQIFTFLYLF